MAVAKDSLRSWRIFKKISMSLKWHYEDVTELGISIGSADQQLSVNYGRGSNSSR